MAIDKTDARKLAQLTRLRLTDAEAEAAAESINAVLAMMEVLADADVDGVDAMARAHERGETLRCREPTPLAGLPRDELLRNAPKSGGGHFLTPKVME